MKPWLTVTVAACVAIAPLRALAAEPGPAPAPTAAPVSPPPDAQTLSRARTFKSVGATSLSVGIGLVVMSGVFWGLRNTALRRADRQKFYVDEQRLIERARRRQIVTGVGLGLGTAMTLVGTSLLIVGAIQKNRAYRTAVLPTVGPGYAGLGAHVRF